ncbi:hypothetical protein M9458_004845, partial [Cirrhinus mrigala]
PAARSFMPAGRRHLAGSAPSPVQGMAYHAAGQAATALHAMATLQVYQAKALKHLDEGGPDQGAMQELRAATDFALRATKVMARSLGQVMSTAVVQERHLWLTLAQMADVDKARFLDAPISQGGLFGDTVEDFAQQFSAVQKQTEAIKHILPRRDSTTMSARPQPPPARRRGRPPPAPKTPALSPAEAHDARLAARRNRAGRGRAAPPASQGPARNTRRRAAKQVEEIALWGMTAPTSPIPVEGREPLCAQTLPSAHGSLFEQRLASLDPDLEVDIASAGTREEDFSPGRFTFWDQSPSPVHSDTHAAVLRAEVAVLLANDAIEPVPPAEMKSGFYSPYFIVPKKSGGLRPILDLRALNRSLLRLPFKMLTTKRMLTCIRHQDWFAAIDLKDAYFHVSILPRRRPFLRFAFEVLPFGLSLSPRVFTKVTEAALSPLWWIGIRILNYLDDWLLIAHSDLVLRHLSHLGLQVNREKSKLSPVQRISFLGVELDSVNMTARLTNERAQSVLNCLNSFRHKTARLLGHMAAAAAVTPLGLLHMRPLQHWLHDRVPRWAWHRGTLQIGVSLQCRRLFSPPEHLVVYTDASSTGWGAVCNGQAASGSWTGPRLQWHINCLELLAVLLALRRFRPMLRHKHVLVRTDSTATVAYINHQGGLRSRRMSQLARHLLLWSQKWLKSLRAVHIPGELNRAADQLSWQSTHPGEWRLHPQVVQLIWSHFGEAQIDLFASPESSHCQLFYSLSEAPLGRDALAHSWPPGPKYAFPPVSLLAQTLCKIREDKEQVLLVAPYWPTRIWFPDLISLAAAPPWKIPLRRDLLSQGMGTIWRQTSPAFHRP